jgi:hypothetical protein
VNPGAKQEAMSSNTSQLAIIRRQTGKLCGSRECALRIVVTNLDHSERRATWWDRKSFNLSCPNPSQQMSKPRKSSFS